jgi:RimJ/RimL family protein N-acetyltransferase/ribosomal protein S18 acetylase RimI-like enzyme
VGDVSLEAPLGRELDWKSAAPPPRRPLRGANVVLRPVDAALDAEPLYAVSHPPAGDPGIWTYLWDGPYEDAQQLRRALTTIETSEDPLFFTIVRQLDERPVGVASYLRITPEFGVMELGHIWFGRPLQRTTAATEAIYMLARRAFEELGYRRLEWKCNALNAASRRAAGRFGFSFEGVFRNHQVVKGRNRDTAWYAILSEDWPAIREGYDAWLAPGNFDPDGIQKRRLGDLIVDSRRGQAVEQGLFPRSDPSPVIRACRVDELPDVLELWRQSRARLGKTDDPASLGALLECDPMALLVAEVDGRIVGSLIAAWDGWRGNLYRLTVLPHLRRRGIARRLVWAGEGHLTSRGARRISALVWREDHSAVGVWAAAGYEYEEGTGRFVKTFGPGSPD